MYHRTDGGLGINEIGRWLGISHRIGPVMTYWVLPRSGIPVSTDTVQMITQAELQTDVVKAQQDSWKEGTKRILEAKNQEVNLPDDVPKGNVFDYEVEDEEFLRNFSMLVDSSSFEGTG